MDLNHLNLGLDDRKISSNSELHVYQALNMPLQYNRVDNGNYQTQNTVTTNNDESQVHTMENSKLSAGKASKNFASKKSSQRSRAIPQANGQGGGQSAYASRSGHYTGRQTGITGNSNLLMTLSRSDMESDTSPLKNDEEIKELAHNYRQNLVTEEEQHEEITATGPLSNIEGMMAVVGTMHSQSGFTGAAATQENLLQNYLTNNSQQADKLESEKSQAQGPIEFHPNNFGLMSCGSDEEELNNKDDQNGQNMSIQSCSQNDVNSNSIASLEDGTNPQHMLSQSLRDIVTNNISDNQIAAILDNDTLQTYTNNNSNCMDLMMVEHNMDTNVQITDQNNYVDINSEGDIVEGNSDVKKR